MAQPTLLTISTRNRMTREMQDIIEVYDAAPTTSFYGSDAQGYTLRLDTDGNSVKYRGSLQPQVRNPNLPEIAGNVLTSQPDSIKLQWDADIPVTCRLRVNSGNMYQVQKTNIDKSDRFTLDVFAFVVE